MPSNSRNDSNTEAVKIVNALKPVIKHWFDEWARSCVRAKKMTVTTAPDGDVIGVTDAFGDTELFVRYEPACQYASPGENVWCEWYFDNMATLHATKMGNLT